jgi:formylglycine-generating enzyme required for sulfatase activity
MLICSIPAGVYPIGFGSQTVTLDAFAIGQTAVTNIEFLAFMAGDGYSNAAYWTEMGWRWQQHKQMREPAFWRDPRFNRPDQPVVGVCWYEAAAFARWKGDGWRLPSEVEWEAAARGVEGHGLPDAHLVNAASGGTWAAAHRGSESWCGALNLCGNVWEWTLSRWGRSWQTMDYAYPYDANDGREEIEGSHARVMRGGSWFDVLSEAHPANRGRFLPGSRASNIGFRLAKSV